MTSQKFQLIEEIHSPARRNFSRRYVELKGVDDLWQMDIVEMIPYAKQNKGYKYILMCINTFTKYGWVRPLKNKSADDVVKAMKSILLTSTPPKLIQTDLGKEFYNSKFKSLMEKNKIKHYSTFSKLKASIVERWNRTIKSKIWKRFSLNGKYNWINDIQNIVKEYNETPHSVTKMKPIDINENNEKPVLIRYKKLIMKKPLLLKKDLKENDFVRISKNKAYFDKGYIPNWSAEIFKIIKINKTNPTTYLLEDMSGDKIMGGFYREELKKTSLKDVYLVEKILKRDKNRLFVKWLGFDKKHNSWIDKNQITN